MHLNNTTGSMARVIKPSIFFSKKALSKQIFFYIVPPPTSISVHVILVRYLLLKSLPFLGWFYKILTSTYIAFGQVKVHKTKWNHKPNWVDYFILNDTMIPELKLLIKLTFQESECIIYKALNILNSKMVISVIGPSSSF